MSTVTQKRFTGQFAFELYGIPLLLVAVGFAVYHSCFHCAFVYDDNLYIVYGSRVHHLWPLWDLFSHSSRPLVLFSLAANYGLGGLNPWGYHFFNVCVHILAALVLYGVVRRTFLSKSLQPQWGGAAPWLAMAVALVWMVHPLQTEAVTYTIQRSESLMGLFYLLTLYCVIRSNGSSPGTWWKTGAVVSCILGIASKEVIVTAPLVVLLYDRAFLSQSWRDVMRRRWGLYAGLAASWLLVPVLMSHASSELTEWHPPSAGFVFKGITPLQYALTQSGVLTHYLRLAVWPHPLCLDYAWPVARTVAQVAPGLIVVGGLLAATLWSWWRQPLRGFLGAWFFIILAPTSSIVPIMDVAVEHRMYLSLAAPVVVMVVSVFLLGKRLLPTQPGLRRTLYWAAGAVSVCVLGMLTYQRNNVYRTELSMWQDTVTRSPNNARAHYNVGNCLVEAGNTKDAIWHYEQTLLIQPDYVEAENNLANVLAQTGNIDAAITHWERALRLAPKYAEAQHNLGFALAQKGQFEAAIRHYELALQIKPDYADAHYHLGDALLRTGRDKEAITHLELALQIKPDYPEARVALEQARSQTSDPGNRNRL